MSQPFEIGLVMAGAVSAGAYTAGVLDFLLQALDAWQKAKDQPNSRAPRHEVRLKVLAGTSAGGMTAAILASALGSDFPPVTDPKKVDPSNKLFHSWVELIDIDQLLEANDLRDPAQPLRSLLDASVLEKIAAYALTPGVPSRRRPYLAEPLHLILTTCNLRGVPYNIPFSGEQPRSGHEMSAHADWLHFCLGGSSDACPKGAFYLDWNQQSRNWALLKDAALATGAFPLGLAPRRLKYRRDVYEGRKWMVPQDAKSIPQGCEVLFQSQEIKPAWPKDIPHGRDYECLCVDGGVMNNEPFDLAHRIMIGNDCSNPRSADAARRALILVDPFPGPDAGLADLMPAGEAEDDIVKVFMALIAAMKHQARFKPEELKLAASPDVYSRFLIAPSRDGERFPIASGSLGGFGGFLSRGFRVHDFMLGRRNCWSFLKNHFLLAETNPLFKSPAWTKEQIDEYRKPVNGADYLPVIPLMGNAAPEPPLPEWPSFTHEELDELASRIGRRYDAVMKRLGQRLSRAWSVNRLAFRLISCKTRKDFVRWVKKCVERELTQFGLMS
mgnify:CR=1 FL=1